MYFLLHHGKMHPVMDIRKLEKVMDVTLRLSLLLLLLVILVILAAKTGADHAWMILIPPPRAF